KTAVIHSGNTEDASYSYWYHATIEAKKDTHDGQKCVTLRLLILGIPQPLAHQPPCDNNLLSQRHPINTHVVIL
uniref:Uncharacterized protein n=1 Tax=Oryza glaberrima TaxID=4538 RepID=I1PIC9_ORYGL